VGKLGDTLRERRIAVGATLEQAQDATKIRATLIKALEEGDYVKLPNPGYVRGYISSYARFLDLDPVPLLAMYKSETGAGRFHELNLPQTDTAVAPTGQQHAVPWRAGVTVVLVLALLSLSVWLVTRLWRGPEPTPPEPAAVSETTTVVGAATETAQVPAVETTEQAKAIEEPVSEVKPFTLVVKVSSGGASWTEITVDGKKAYVGTLTGGQQKKFEVAEEAKVLAGKPSVVTVTRDGKKV